MKTKMLIYPFLLSGVFLFIISGCKKKEDSSNPTPAPETVTDIDGNVYHTVTIGTQVWMVENLRTTRYNDGTLVPLVTEQGWWRYFTTPGYCFYNNDEAAYKDTYGALYNGYAVQTGKLAPKGWHIPNDEEWTTLITYLGGADVAGGKMKEAGSNHWGEPNTGATNSSGFSALPGGVRSGQDGSFYARCVGGYWWSSTGLDNDYLRDISLMYTSAKVVRLESDKWNGQSVRCIMD